LREKEGVEARAWDMKYGESLLKSYLLDKFDIKDTRQYFRTARVFPALLRLVEKLFRLRFENVEKIEGWHDSVTASEVYDVSQGDAVLIGRVFFDLYPRKGKLAGASAWLVRGRVPGKRLAEVVLNANMPENPSACMSYLDVRTLLHELGHCIHNLVAANRYVRFAGIGETQQDFVEAPSQMLELWLTDHQLFDFALNDKGEAIPKDTLRQLIVADGIGRGLALRSQWILMKYAVSRPN
jgi:Zn-dependent oligopeptidase